MITREEKNQILFEFNDTTVDYPRDKTVHRLVEKQEEKTPDAVAVTGPWLEAAAVTSPSPAQRTVTVTYAQLNREANRQAALLMEKGAGRDHTVGILMDRSLSMITAILAVWKAGSAYIPLDPAAPVRRIAGVLEDSGTELAVTDPRYVSTQVKEAYTQTVILPCQTTHAAPPGNHRNPHLEIRMQDLAYVIYTSGSTGKPKGAPAEHPGMQNHTPPKVRDLSLTRNAIVAQNASHTFDISVWQ
ncbi:MAG: AMP-binding protein, partial [bacterium]|nr:AMP-binding protein [bacterium]